MSKIRPYDFNGTFWLSSLFSINSRNIFRKATAKSHMAVSVCQKTKRPFKVTGGLVSGRYKSERALPIGNPCDAELTNLMQCMRANDYDNIPCRGKIYLI